MNVPKEFLSMFVDGRLIVDACLLGDGNMLGCHVGGDSEVNFITVLAGRLPSYPGYVYMFYKRRSGWVYFLVPLARSVWLLLKASYGYLAERRSMHVLLDTLTEMSYRIGTILEKKYSKTFLPTN